MRIVSVIRNLGDLECDRDELHAVCPFQVRHSTDESSPVDGLFFACLLVRHAHAPS